VIGEYDSNSPPRNQGEVVLNNIAKVGDPVTLPLNEICLAGGKSRADCDIFVNAVDPMDQSRRGKGVADNNGYYSVIP
jgi:hypothetical protein